MRRACGQACCWGGAAAVAPVRVCTKVMALQPGPREGRTVKLPGFDVMSLYIFLDVLHKSRRPSHPHRSAAAAHVARCEVWNMGGVRRQSRHLAGDALR